MIEDHPLHIAFYVKANNGVRRGELLDITWRVINFDNARLSVAQTVTAPDYTMVVPDVKSVHSLRTIDLTPRIVSILRSWWKRQARHTYRPTTQYSQARAQRITHLPRLLPDLRPAAHQTRSPQDPTERIAPHPRHAPDQGKRTHQGH